MAYPNGTPSSGLSNPYTNTAFTPLDNTKGIRDNLTSINKASLTDSFGYQLSLIQNFVNKRFLGRWDVPVQDIYGTSGHFNNVTLSGYDGTNPYYAEFLPDSLHMYYGSPGNDETKMTSSSFQVINQDAGISFEIYSHSFEIDDAFGRFRVNRNNNTETVVIDENSRSGIIIAATNPDKATFVTLSGTTINLNSPGGQIYINSDPALGAAFHFETSLGFFASGYNLLLGLAGNQITSQYTIAPMLPPIAGNSADIGTTASPFMHGYFRTSIQVDDVHTLTMGAPPSYGTKTASMEPNKLWLSNSANGGTTKSGYLEATASGIMFWKWGAAGLVSGHLLISYT